jgi:hypothetical protein
MARAGRRMPDSVTVTTRQSWVSRIVGAVVGIPVGLLMFAAAFPLIWWNEGHAVHRAQSLQEGASVVVDVPAAAVNPANEGKLVHVTGLATGEQAVTDPDLGLSATAIRMERIAETYQWRETSSSKKSRKLGGSEETTTTYKYEKIWSRSLIDSSSFKSPEGHENPTSLPWESRTTTSGRVTCGAFTLSSDLIDKIGGATARPGEAEDVEKMRTAGFATELGGTFYKGSPANPRIGDVRVRFEVVTPQTISLVAVQRGSSFAAYEAKAGSSILMLETGSVPADRMFTSALTKNTILTWVLRAAGLLLMFVGLVLVLRPVSVLGSVIPAVGSILGAGTAAVAFLVALTLSFMTMALAWVAYRPLLALGLVAVAIASLVLLLRKRRPKSVVPPPIPTGA